jgi:hypothetical protein
MAGGIRRGGRVGFAFRRGGRVKKDQVGFFISVDWPNQPFRIPLERLDFRACLRVIDQIK